VTRLSAERSSKLSLHSHKEPSGSLGGFSFY
jgi:hypothetical protein